MAVRARKASGAYAIRSLEGETFSETQGSAVSKALTVAARIQRHMDILSEPSTVYVRNALDDVVARVDVSKTLIQVVVAR